MEAKNQNRLWEIKSPKWTGDNFEKLEPDFISIEFDFPLTFTFLINIIK